MRKNFAFAAIIVFSVVTSLLSVSPGVEQSTGKVQLTGHWMFNPGLSEDGVAKIRQVKSQVEAARNGVIAIGTMQGEGASPGGGGLGAGGDTWGAPDGPNFKEKVWSRLAENPRFLDIDQKSDKILVATDSGRTQTFYPDGNKHEERDVDGKKTTVKAAWNGSSFVAETKLSHDRKITQTFNLMNDVGRLVVTTRFDIVSLNEPLVIRRVYDIEKQPGK